MQVFDLTRLRDYSGTMLTFEEDAHYDRISSVHNIVINEESGFAYAVGSGDGGDTCGGGLHMIDIRDPKSPSFAGCFADPNTGRVGDRVHPRRAMRHLPWDPTRSTTARRSASARTRTH